MGNSSRAEKGASGKGWGEGARALWEQSWGKAGCRLKPSKLIPVQVLRTGRILSATSHTTCHSVTFSNKWEGQHMFNLANTSDMGFESMFNLGMGGGRGPASWAGQGRAGAVSCSIWS